MRNTIEGKVRDGKTLYLVRSVFKQYKRRTIIKRIIKKVKNFWKEFKEYKPLM